MDPRIIEVKFATDGRNNAYLLVHHDQPRALSTEDSRHELS